MDLTTIILLITLFLMIFLWYMGLFKVLSFQQAKLGPLKIFYLEYIGEYHKVGPTFQLVCRDTKPYFKFARCFGLYYDPPHKVRDKKHTRAIIGVILNNGESSQKEEEFAKAHINYKRSELPLVDAIVTRFPYRNFLTYFLFGKVYRAINNYLMGKNKQNHEEAGKNGIMEIYYINKSKSFIEFWIPFGYNAEKYLLSTAPRPLYIREHDE